MTNKKINFQLNYNCVIKTKFNQLREKSLYCMISVHAYLPADSWGEILHNESMIRPHRRAISVQQKRSRMARSSAMTLR